MTFKFYKERFYNFLENNYSLIELKIKILAPNPSI